MFKKLMVCLMLLGLGGCTLLSIPLAVVDTAAGIVKLPITAVVPKLVQERAGETSKSLIL